MCLRDLQALYLKSSHSLKLVSATLSGCWLQGPTNGPTHACCMQLGLVDERAHDEEVRLRGFLAPSVLVQGSHT